MASKKSTKHKNTKIIQKTNVSKNQQNHKKKRASRKTNKKHTKTPQNITNTPLNRKPSTKSQTIKKQQKSEIHRGTQKPLKKTQNIHKHPQKHQQPITNTPLKGRRETAQGLEGRLLCRSAAEWPATSTLNPAGSTCMPQTVR